MKNPERPTPQEYHEFVRGLELLNVRLVGCEMASMEVVREPEQVEISLEQRTTFNVFDEGFEALQDYRFAFTREQNEVGHIDLEFAFVYESEFANVDDDIDPYLSIFKMVSLPVNVWPFAREFVHSMTSRMGWPTLDLPLLKPDIPNDQESPSKGGSE